MLVNRRVIKVKLGCTDSMIALLKGEEDRLAEKIPYEVLTPDFGTQDVVVWEGRFESLAQYEAFWSTWAEQESTVEFFNTFNTLAETGGTNELWVAR